MRTKCFSQKIFFVIFCGLLIPLRAGAVTLTPSLAQSSQTARIIALSNRSHDAAKTCIVVLSALKQKTRDSQRSEYYVSRASALAVLNEGLHFPGTPLATSDAIDIFLNMDELPAGQLGQDLRAAVLSLSDCHAAEFYGFLTRLIDPRTQRLLSFQDRLRARNLVVRYLRREATEDSEPPIQTRLVTQLLERSVREGLLEISPQGKADLESLLWRLRQYRAENSPVLDKGACPGKDLEVCRLYELSAKFEEAEDIRYDLEDLIDSESQQGYLLPEAGPAVGAPLAFTLTRKGGAHDKKI